MKIKIHIPDFKSSKIGYAMTPTCISEAPANWGLSKNAFIVYMHLISRIKKSSYFNGAVVKKRMEGFMGQSTVANALKELCDLGFCIKTPNRGCNGQMAGWDYQFFAIPQRREIVASVDEKLAEKLDKIDWFCDDPSSVRTPGELKPETQEPRRENRLHGETPFNSKEGKSKEGTGNEGLRNENEKVKSPLPLSQKEGDPTLFFSGEDEEISIPDTSSREGDVKLESGRWFKDMLTMPGGRLLLESLDPDQIPDDKSLRRPTNLLKKGELTRSYICYLIEKIVQPNQKNHSRNGSPLLTITEIVEYLKDPNFASHSDDFKRWKGSKILSLRNCWKKLNESLSDPNSLERVVESKKSEYEFQVYDSPDDYENGTFARRTSPFEYLIFLRNEVDAGRIYQAIIFPPKWKQLLRDAAYNHKEFYSLAELVHHFDAQIQHSLKEEFRNLHENWVDQHESLRNEIEEEFARMGSSPPDLAQDN